MLSGGALSVAVAAPVAGSAGLSGREPASDEVRESAPLFTALASRSWRREFGRLRDELRGASMQSALLDAYTSLGSTHLAQLPASSLPLFSL
jgi:hypothetical protein